MDKYRCFQELKEAEKEHHYAVHFRRGYSGVAVIAPHGGEIEPGCLEIAEEVAGIEHTFYCFEGLKRAGSGDLHITSTSFDEPAALAAVRDATYVLSIHGCLGDEAAIYIGGLDIALKARIRASLIAGGFSAEKHWSPYLQGIHPRNICNRGARGKGVQLELPEGLRGLLFDGLDSRGRRNTRPLFGRLVTALRQALE